MTPREFVTTMVTLFGGYKPTYNTDPDTYGRWGMGPYVPLISGGDSYPELYVFWWPGHDGTPLIRVIHPSIDNPNNPGYQGRKFVDYPVDNFIAVTCIVREIIRKYYPGEVKNDP